MVISVYSTVMETQTVVWEEPFCFISCYSKFTYMTDEDKDLFFISWSARLRESLLGKWTKEHIHACTHTHIHTHAHTPTQNYSPHKHPQTEWNTFTISFDCGSYSRNIWKKMLVFSVDFHCVETSCRGHFMTLLIQLDPVPFMRLYRPL